MGKGSQSNENVFFISMKNMKKSDDKCYLRCYEGKTKKEEEIDFVDGQLYKIKFDDATYEGKTFRQIHLYLRDNGEVYILKSRFTNAMRGILNKLLACTSFINIKIGVFGNAGDYKNAYVQANNEKLPYQFTKEDLEAYIDTQVNPKGETDKYYHRLDTFLESKIQQIVIPQLDVDAITEKDEQEIKEQSNNPKLKEGPSVLPEENSNDVPF